MLKAVGDEVLENVKTREGGRGEGGREGGREGG
jgi:hypothetical protein